MGYKIILIFSFFLLTSQIYIEHINKNINSSDCKRKDEVLNLLVKVHQRELEHCDKYQFLTAQDSRFFAYQVIAKTVFETMNCIRMENFEFLRYPHTDLLKSAEEFFKKYPFLKQPAPPHLLDLDAAISRQVISASLSMETDVPGDSAFFVFISGEGISQWFSPKKEEHFNLQFQHYVEELFENAGILKAVYQPYLRELLDCAPRTPEGIINQIFLPKEQVGKYLYMSTTGGGVDEEGNKNIVEAIEKYQKSRTSCDFDRKKNIQARIIVGSLFDGKALIYRYTLIPEAEQERYKAHVREVICKILKAK